MFRWKLAAIPAALAALIAAAIASSGSALPQTVEAAGVCSFANGIKHVIYLQFDNLHYRRDLPNVPSDLEQMPHLLDFMRQNGTLLTNDHTILISHTAGGILSSLTGLYPDRNGITVSNSYDYYRNNGLPTFTSAFKYWTDTVDGADDPLPNMVGTDWQSRTAQPPWLTYTQAGCDVGGVSAANIELENTSTADSGDMTRVFGASSPEWNEAKANPDLALADFVGIAVHCAKGSGLCTGPNARPDDLTTDPGSSQGYKALFGAKYVNPAITGGNACVNDTSGQPIKDPKGNCGFPGFDGALAKNTLGEVFQMQKSGVPVTFAYISDAHDNHTLARASGPGEADYKQQLADYDAAFATFFQQLAGIGIDKSNTLFVVTVDEGDHYAGAPGTPQSDGSLAYAHDPCTDLTKCPANQIGEVNGNIKGLLPAGEPGFDIHFDSAPTFYVNGDPNRPNGPGANDSSVRKLERDLLSTTAVDPYAGGQAVPIVEQMADKSTQKALHMVNADPKRTPTFTMFGNADFFWQTSNPCTGVAVCVNPKFAWNHGDIQPEIGNTWVGFVGPGVRPMGADSTIWTDHTDVRPTILGLLGLTDSYQDDGRVLTQILNPGAVTPAIDNPTGVALGAMYKQLNAPFGEFGLDLLAASTKALATGSSTDDSAYTGVSDRIAALTSRRDWLAAEIRGALDRAAFRGGLLFVDQSNAWMTEGQNLLVQARELALNPFGTRGAFTAAVYGDAPYGTTPADDSQTKATPAFINALNADPNVSLVVHVGDIHSGKQYCTQVYDQAVFDMWSKYDIRSSTRLATTSGPTATSRARAGTSMTRAGLRSTMRTATRSRTSLSSARSSSRRRARRSECTSSR
jgi:hypothetical protein